ncbi:glycosyltransferase [Lutimonas saemankumensis]|uniref:glycosyltransferase family 2 protein n=1 Tax=Lutimonas saemankumensis TaxID=483016 RepID=UPI001CD6B987|nr:glycosyltransferase [Lutimonas saemankumensis]MCA0932654.1 glycosyltransferase [Lutimonas saemankumensis]
MTYDNFKEPLASVIVITYNSEKYVLETLESTKNQTYKNIELIISDDCSSDRTIDICESWLKKNKSHFRNSMILKSSENLGTVKNMNKGYQFASADWLKFIAGDDILLNNCIEDLVFYCKTHPSCEILFGKVNILSGKNIFPYQNLEISTATENDQKKLVYHGSGLPAPGCMLSKKILDRFNGFDESYFLMEDVPFWIKVVNEGIKIHFSEDTVVNYRRHGSNVHTINKNEFYINKSYFRDAEKLIKREILPYLLEHRDYFMALHYYNYLLISQLVLFFGNRNNFLSKMLNLFILRTTVLRIRNKVMTLISS